MLAVTLCALPFLSSRPRYNVDSMKFVSALALDFDGDYILTAYSKDGVLAAGRGESIEKAFSAASENCGGNLFYGTASGLFIGSTASEKERLSELAAYATSCEELRLSVPVVLCTGRASDECLAKKELMLRADGTKLSLLIESVYTEAKR